MSRNRRSSASNLSSSSARSLASNLPPPVRCAIYTRKSTEEGLDQQFNSLDAQREAAEAFIASQRHEGWVVNPQRYDDGGFSGGNIERPALKRLLADIDAGKVDCVVVYKVDRLSRSLLDFARIMEVFDQRKVSFVSVTQQFNTTHSMGRLTLNILLSFAQFEREIIGERIRDKIAAQRRKGKWTGGTPVLGYDVDRTGPSPKLAVNAAEAIQVREIFSMYLKLGSLLPVVEELVKRRWISKKWTTKAGAPIGGRSFDKCRLHALLTNPIYVGRIKHKAKEYVGEHEPIVDIDVFEKVQVQLRRNGQSGGAEARNRYGALLKRLLYCKACGKAMVHHFTGRSGKRYRYYTCVQAIKSGRKTCPSKSLPAAAIEQLVVDKIRGIARDTALRADVVRQALALAEGNLAELKRERQGLQRDVARYNAEVRRLVAHSMTAARTARLADLQEQMARAESRLAEVRRQMADQEAGGVDEAGLSAAFADFDRVWNALSPREQAEALSLLVARVEYDAAESTIAVTFQPSGIKALALNHQEDAA
jgi:site-specific DNA recombinase